MKVEDELAGSDRGSGGEGSRGKGRGRSRGGDYTRRSSTGYSDRGLLHPHLALDFALLPAL